MGRGERERPGRHGEVTARGQRPGKSVPRRPRRGRGATDAGPITNSSWRAAGWGGPGTTSPMSSDRAELRARGSGVLPDRRRDRCLPGEAARVPVWGGSHQSIRRKSRITSNPSSNEATSSITASRWSTTSRPSLKFSTPPDAVMTSSTSLNNRGICWNVGAMSPEHASVGRAPRRQTGPAGLSFAGLPCGIAPRLPRPRVRRATRSRGRRLRAWRSGCLRVRAAYRANRSSQRARSHRERSQPS